MATLRLTTRLFLAVLICVLTPAGSVAQDPPAEPEVTEQKIVADDASSNARFGSGVAIDSTFALIGSSDDNTNGDNAGSAYLFVVVDSIWVQRQRIFSGDASADGRFGASVSLSRPASGLMSGMTAAIGSPGTGNDRGSVYVFRESAGMLVQQQKIEADDGQASDGFGKSLSVNRDVLVVGSAGNDANGVDAGAAYVYHYNGSSWIQQIKLQAPVVSPGELFGVSVGVYGDLIAVGASRNDSSGTDAGTVYIFRNDGTSWVFEAQLLAEDGFDYDLLGTAVDVADSLVIGGAYGNDQRGQNAGSAYIWKHDGIEWLQVTRLEAEDAAPDDHFGFTVALTDSLAVIGSHWDNQNGNFSGSAYIFQNELTGWLQIHKLTAGDGEELDLFGESVAVNAYTAFIGAPREDHTSTDAGAAYFYEIPRPDPPPPSVAIENLADGVPDVFRISSVYPNPFRDRLTVDVELVNPAPFVVTIYNIVGQEVARFDSGNGTIGRNQISWDAGNMAAGIYLIRAQSSGQSATSKVVHIR